jgi:hypothetical protein
MGTRTKTQTGDARSPGKADEAAPAQAPLRARAARTYVIRGDAFCVSVGKLSDDLVAELLRMQDPKLVLPAGIKTRAGLFAAVLKMLRDLSVSARKNRLTERVYVSLIGKRRVGSTFFFYGCDDWVRQLAMRQQPNIRRRPGRQASRRLP